MSKSGDRLIGSAKEARELAENDAARAAEIERVTAAVNLITDFIRREFIVDECRDAPCFGCASCEAVNLERQLSAMVNSL